MYKILFIGFGSISKKHISIIKKNFNAKIFLISKHFKGNANIKKISLKNALKSKFDYCFICTSASERINYLKLLKKNSNFFFLEKPISNDEIKVKKLFTDLKLKKKLFVGYVFRRNLMIKKLQIFIKKNLKYINGVQVISKSYMPNWRKEINYRNSVSSDKVNGGVLYELSHEIDLLYYLFKNIKLYSANLSFSKDLNIKVEDRADIIFKFYKNKVINLSLDFNSYINERRIIINTNKFDIDVNINENFFRIYNKNQKMKLYSFKNENRKMFERQIEEFFKKKINLNDLNQSLKVLKIINEIKKY